MMARTGYKTFTISDFSGGLNTAVAESRLDAKFSPALYNVDFTDTGAITRRSGYVDMRAAEAVTGNTVDDGSLTLSGVSASPLSGYHLYVQQSFPGWDGYLTSFEFRRDGNVSATSTHDMRLYRGDPSSSGVLLDTVKDVPYVTGTHNVFFTSPQAVVSGTNYYVRLRNVTLAATNFICQLAYSNGDYASGALTTPYGSGESAGDDLTFAAYGYRTDSINGLYRYYQTDGDKYWVMVAGTAVLAQTDYTTDMEPTTWQAEDYYVSASTTGAVTSNAAWSAGEGVWLNATGEICTLRVPAAGEYAIGLNQVSPSVVGGSIRIGYGEWQDFSSVTEYIVTGDTSATNVIHVKLVSGDDVCVDYVRGWTSSAWQREYTTLSASTEHFGFATLDDKCYISSAYDRMVRFNGATVVSATLVTATPPQGSFVIEHKRRLWTAGDNTDPAALYYTDVDEPEDWDGGGVIYLAGKDAGAGCTGLVPFDNKVFYFSDSRIYAIDPTGPDTNWTAAMAGYNAISWSLGNIAPKSLVQTDNALIFLSADGVRAYGYIPGMYSQDGSGLIDLSENIRPTLDTISEAMKPKAAGAFYNGKYYLSCALDGATTNNAILVYSIPSGNKPGAWTKYTGFDVTCFCVTRGDEYGLYAGTSAGKFIKLDTGTNDDGSAIEMYYQTPQLAPGGFETMKHFKQLHIAAESDTVQQGTIGVTTDDVMAADQTASFTSNTAAQPVRLNISSRGRSIQYDITASGAAQPLNISRLTTVYHSKKVR